MTVTQFPIRFNNSDVVLALDNKGGSGHTEALKAIKKDNPDCTFHTYEVIGKDLASIFNNARKSGNPERIKMIVSLQKIGEVILFFPLVFLLTFFKLIFNKKITHVLDAQPLGTKASVTAARLANWIQGRNIKVYKVLTDFPTRSEHFAAPIRMLSEGDRKIFKLYSMAPYTKKDDEILEDFQKRKNSFWKRKFHLSPNEVEYFDTGPVRPAYHRLPLSYQPPRPENFAIKINNDEEKSSIEQLLGKSLEVNEDKCAKITIDPGCKICMMSIGSQAPIDGTKEAVFSFIEKAKKYTTPVVLFVCCGRHTPQRNTLFKQLAEEIKAENLPSHIKVLPLGYQDDEEKAPMDHYSDAIFTGAGGMQSFETIRARRKGHPGQIFLYAHLPRKVKPLRKLLLTVFPCLIKEVDEELPSTYDLLSPEAQKLMIERGTYLWEKGNAEWLLENRGSQNLHPIQAKDFGEGLERTGFFLSP
ncbi:MAG: hypothetical protein H7A37_06415 [Chlamydiales bacterium]|nr:hypothetical protein [Chlamydiia bacterium]MCP5507915.1 hypothetical protein [Chlamydiales bacterium]